LVLSNEWVTVKKHTQADIRHAVVFTCEWAIANRQTCFREVYYRNDESETSFSWGNFLL